MIDELSVIVHASRAVEVAKHMCTKLLDIIPRQQFQVAIQAAVGAKILARENLKAFRKDITSKLVIITNQIIIYLQDNIIDVFLFL